MGARFHFPGHYREWSGDVNTDTQELKKMKHIVGALVLALSLASATEALAQGRGGGGGGGFGGGGGGFGGGSFGREGFGQRVSPQWLASPEVAGGKKYMLIYICPTTEDQDPVAFQNLDVAAASRKDWGFVKIPHDRDNKWIKAWSIRRIPCIVGADIHANSFRIAPGNAIQTVRAIISSVPPLIERYKASLKKNFKSAKTKLERNRASGIKSLVTFLLKAKPGYDEVEEAAKLLRELGAEDIKQGELAESVGADQAIKYYEGLVKTYKTTPPGVLAQIKIARLEHQKGKSTAASLRLRKLEDLEPSWLEPERNEAARVRQELSKK